jgi:hypothetical protein
MQEWLHVKSVLMVSQSTYWERLDMRILALTDDQ